MAKRNIPENDIGRKYGRLTVTGVASIRYTPNGTKRTFLRTVCDCGNEKSVQSNSLRTGRTLSCGCLNLEQSRLSTRKHGATTGGVLTPEWRAWRDMLTRATNPNIRNAKQYSGRNIGVCADWAYGGDGKGFERFLAHVGYKPTKKHSLDRIDNDRGYEPGNVRWATSAQQARNKTDNRIVQWRGQSMCLTAACESEGLRLGAVLDRLNKLGWSLERALNTPLKPDKRRI